MTRFPGWAQDARAGREGGPLFPDHLVPHSRFALIEFACQAPRVYHHDWAPGDTVIWDNRCLLHRATPWDMTEPRVMWHSRLAGDPASEAALARAMQGG